MPAGQDENKSLIQASKRGSHRNAPPGAIFIFQWGSLSFFHRLHYEALLRRWLKSSRPFYVAETQNLWRASVIKTLQKSHLLTFIFVLNATCRTNWYHVSKTSFSSSSKCCMFCSFLCELHSSMVLLLWTSQGAGSPSKSCCKMCAIDWFTWHGPWSHVGKSFRIQFYAIAMFPYVVCALFHSTE